MIKIGDKIRLKRNETIQKNLRGAIGIVIDIYEVPSALSSGLAYRVQFNYGQALSYYTVYPNQIEITAPIKIKLKQFSAWK